MNDMEKDLKHKEKLCILFEYPQLIDAARMLEGRIRCAGFVGVGGHELVMLPSVVVSQIGHKFRRILKGSS